MRVYISLVMRMHKRYAERKVYPRETSAENDVQSPGTY